MQTPAVSSYSVPQTLRFTASDEEAEWCTIHLCQVMKQILSRRLFISSDVKSQCNGQNKVKTPLAYSPSLFARMMQNPSSTTINDKIRFAHLSNARVSGPFTLKFMTQYAFCRVSSSHVYASAIHHFKCSHSGFCVQCTQTSQSQFPSIQHQYQKWSAQYVLPATFPSSNGIQRHFPPK